MEGERAVIQFSYRPIERWPGELTKNRKTTPFRVSFDNTVRCLSDEVEALGAHAAVIQLALTDGEIRKDGMIRANSRPSHPGVIVAFETKKLGPLQFATDVFEGYWSGQVGWHANLRAVALGLEALRKVDRYGITRRGEQYTGWQALPPGVPLGPAKMTADEAARLLADEADETASRADIARKLLDGDAELLSKMYRRAARRLHPDLGGDPEQFRKVDEARRLLEATR